MAAQINAVAVLPKPPTITVISEKSGDGAGRPPPPAGGGRPTKARDDGARRKSSRRASRAFDPQGEVVYDDPAALARDGKRPVSFSVTVYALSSMDPAVGTFFADIGMHMMWFEPALVDSGLYRDGMHHTTELTQEYMDLVHVPGVYVDNSLSLEDVNQPFVNVRAKDPRGVVRWEQRRRGTFSEIFELQAFPFDVQTISFCLRVNSKADELRGRYAARMRSAPSHVKPGVHLAEWHLYAPVAQAGADHKGKPCFRCHVVLRRRHQYFTANVLLLMGAMCSLAFVAFVVPFRDVEARSSIVLTLLLTAVAFKFVVGDALPKVSYSTALDFYFHVVFLFLICIFSENGLILVVGRGYGDSVRATMDRRFFYAAASAWALFNAVFFLGAWRYVRRTKALLGPELNADAAAGRRAVPAQRLKMFPWLSALHDCVCGGASTGTYDEDGGQRAHAE